MKKKRTITMWLPEPDRNTQRVFIATLIIVTLAILYVAGTVAAIIIKDGYGV